MGTFVAVTLFKQNSFFWYLSSPILLLFFEGLFTLAIKENQEWKWFCPSVFLYLLSVIPSIWILELEKIDRKMKSKDDTFNLTASASDNLKDLNDLIGVDIKLPDLALSTETWITVIEQFLMLILIIGRWMLPKGELTRDQLSQLLLVYIGTAADIIEFFDSFKDDKVASHHLLVLLTLSIWSWSLMQFTVVLTATKSRKSRLTTGSSISSKNNFCGIDVWGIAINISLQDAPFLVFRLLLITHFNIISYMNIFFTCKNTLVIVLQLYRLHVVYGESRKKKNVKRANTFELTDISIISKPEMTVRPAKARKKRVEEPSEESTDDDFSESDLKRKKIAGKSKASRKDTGYSTGSSLASTRKNKKKVPDSSDEKGESSAAESRSKKREKQKLTRSDKDTKGHKTAKDESSEDDSEEARRSKRRNKKKTGKRQSKKSPLSDPSSE